MFDKFLSLFRGQVSSAVTDGADDGLKEADLSARVKTAVEEGVQDALDGLHKLLAKPAKKSDKDDVAASNGHSRISGTKGAKVHANGKR